MKKPPRYNVVVSERARQMVHVHMRFLAKVSPESAQKTRKTIGEAIRSLAVMPERYPFFSGDAVQQNKYRRMPAGKRYLLLYQIRENTVFVDHIFDCRQDYGWLID